MRKILLLTSTLLISVFALAQTTGDYQSFTSGNWSDASTWLRYNGSSFVAAATAPSSSDGVISILSGHTVTVNSSVTTDETIVNAGGILTLTSSLNIADGPGNDLTVNGSFNFISGTLSGAGIFIVNAGMDWQGGSMQSNLVLTSTAVSSKTTVTTVSIANFGVLTNNGAFTWAAGNIELTNGSFNNGIAGIINITGDDVMTTSGGTRFFNNAGLVIKSAGTGTTAINVNGSNSGTINVNAGTISSGGTFDNASTIGIASGKTFLVNSGTFSLNTGSKSNGAGKFEFSAGALAINAPAGTPATATNYLFTGGLMNGTGTLSVTTSMDWQGGSMQSNLVLASTAVSSKTTVTTVSISNFGILTNNGAFTWAAGNIELTNGTFNNGVTGTINITGDDVMSTSGGIRFFNNEGTVIKSTGSGTTSFTVNSANTGTIKGIGTLDFQSSFTSDGIIAPGTSPGLLTINGSQPLSANSTLQIEMQSGSGPGTGHDQLIRAGSMTLAGTLTVTEIGAVPPGTYTIINLTSGTTSGSFATTTLPPGYSLLVNLTNVQLVKSGPLPLSLISFTGSKQNNDALLQWRTANEVNLSRFEIQRSENGFDFITIGTVMPGSSMYSFVDPNIFVAKAIAYYRLKSIDIDNRFAYWSIIRLSKQAGGLLTVYPNPVKDVLTAGGLKQGGTIRLLGTDGKLLQQQQVTTQTMTVDMTGYPAGMYWLQYSNNEGETQTRKIIKN
jgi:Secretion system C-terminal sorting domain